MKLFLSLLLFVSWNAQAITVKSCPQAMTITLGDFEQGKEGPSPYLDNPGGAKAAYNYMKYMDELTVDLELRGTSNSECRYSEVDGSRSAVVSGSLRENAKRPARISVFWSVELNGGVMARYNATIPLTDLTPASVALTYPNGFAVVRNPNRYCEWGECAPAYEYVGKANLVEVEVR